jgi:hypothetical protein
MDLGKYVNPVSLLGMDIHAAVDFRLRDFACNHKCIVLTTHLILVLLDARNILKFAKSTSSAF